MVRVGEAMSERVMGRQCVFKALIVDENKSKTDRSSFLYLFATAEPLAKVHTRFLIPAQACQTMDQLRQLSLLLIWCWLVGCESYIETTDSVLDKHLR